VVKVEEGDVEGRNGAGRFDSWDWSRTGMDDERKRGKKGRTEKDWVGREGGRVDRWSVRGQRECEKDRRMLKEGREQKAEGERDGEEEGEREGVAVSRGM
jgi:hypothetical protein